MYMYILVNLLFLGPQKFINSHLLQIPLCQLKHIIQCIYSYLRVLDNSMMLQCIYHNNSDQFINEIVSNKRFTGISTHSISINAIMKMTLVM